MRIRSLFVFLLALLISTAVCAEPYYQMPSADTPGRQTAPEDEARVKIEKDMAKKRNEDRQKQLKRDTAKLLELSTELKEYVDKTNEHILSLDVLKKADEIEKLAHSVKEKMKSDN